MNSSYSLATVDDDIFRLDPFFQHSLLGMFTSSSEQTRRLNLKISYSFFVVIQQTVSIFIHYLLIGFLQRLQQILKVHIISHKSTLFKHKDYKMNRETELYQFLLFAHVFLSLHFGFMHGVNFTKVALFKIFNQGPLLRGHFLNRQTKESLIFWSLNSTPKKSGYTWL